MPLYLDNQTYFLSVIHFTNELNKGLIYGIRLNTNTFYLSKSFGINDCEQLNTHPILDAYLLNKIGIVITEVEKEYKQFPPREPINKEILKKLLKNKSLY